MDWACEVETSQPIWCVRRPQYETQQFNQVTCGQKDQMQLYFMTSIVFCLSSQTMSIKKIRTDQRIDS